MVSGMKKEFLSLFEIDELTVLLLVPVALNKDYTGCSQHIPVVFVLFSYQLQVARQFCLTRAQAVYNINIYLFFCCFKIINTYPRKVIRNYDKR